MITPAQHIEAETLQPGRVVHEARASGGQALQLDRGGLVVQLSPSAPTRVRIVARAPGCTGTLQADGRRRRVTRRWRSLVVPYRTSLTLRPGRCAVRVDTIDVEWTPAPSATWQWQLTGPIDLSVPAQVYDVDLFDTPASTVDAIHAAGARAVCYFSAGTLEKGRPDPYPSRVAGRALPDWPDERWLDIRKRKELGPILRRRLALCARKGFDGAEADNVDAYANSTGFKLTAADQLRFNRFLARTAHRYGLAIALKNDLDQVAALQPSFDFALNEQCFQYQECDKLRPFTAAGKAVWEVEYEQPAAAFCGAARAAGFMAQRKQLELDATREPCW